MFPGATEVCNGLDDNCDGGTDDVSCDDGQACNGQELCGGLLGCQPGAPPVPDDGVACTVDSCDVETDVFIHLPVDSLCANDNECTIESCDAATGCESSPAAAGTACGAELLWVCDGSGVCAPPGPCDGDVDGLFVRSIDVGGAPTAADIAVLEDDTIVVAYQIGATTTVGALSSDGSSWSWQTDFDSVGWPAIGPIDGIDVGLVNAAMQLSRLDGSDGEVKWVVSRAKQNFSFVAGDIAPDGSVVAFGRFTDTSAGPGQWNYEIPLALGWVGKDGTGGGTYASAVGSGTCWYTAVAGVALDGGGAVIVGSRNDQYSQGCGSYDVVARLDGAASGSAVGLDAGVYKHYVYDASLGLDGTLLVGGRRIASAIGSPPSYFSFLTGLAPDGYTVDWTFVTPADSGIGDLEVLSLSAGYAFLRTHYSGVRLQRLDSERLEVWSRQLPLTPGSPIYEMVGTHDGGFAIVASDGGEMVVIRTDPWGHASCAESGGCHSMGASGCDDGSFCTHDLCSAAAGGCYTAPKDVPGCN